MLRRDSRLPCQATAGLIRRSSSGLLLALLLVGCGRPGGDARIVATIPPLRAVVEPISGEAVDVLVPAGASPHTYEPKPSDARQAARASILFYGSDELDGWSASLASGTRVALVDLLPDSVRRPAAGGGDTDPHFWMDPLAVRALAPHIAAMLCDVAPERCETFRNNARTFAGALDVVHDSLRAMMAPVAGASVLSSHPFLQYFAARYGLHVVGVVEEMTGSEPTPRDLERMISAVRSSGARAIFIQPQHSARAAEAVSDATGIPVVELDPVGGANELADLLYLNARMIRDALLDRP